MRGLRSQPEASGADLARHAASLSAGCASSAARAGHAMRAGPGKSESCFAFKGSGISLLENPTRVYGRQT